MATNQLFPFESILHWYQENGRHTLPWRQIYHLPDYDRVYRVWIAEVMLQQTQVNRVIGYYERFIIRFPTLKSLAESTYDEVFPYYQGLGYYGRARRMLELAQFVEINYSGIFPRSLEELKKLPGVGDYTAQAILAFGYDEPILSLDANLLKIFGRYYLGTRFVDKKVLDTLTTRLQKQTQKSVMSGRDINNALMDFGALMSTTFDTIDSVQYPLRDCLWFQTKGKMEIREKTAKKTQKKGIKNYCLVFLHQDHKYYWSSHASHYEPFLVEPVSIDDRASIQDYFSATYGLEVSVRPSFGRGEILPGTFFNNPLITLPVKLFHAQIQTGKITLPQFSKGEKENWIAHHLVISK